MTIFTSSLVDHPGTIIAEELDERGWVQADLAYILGMDAGQLSKLINGKIDITPDMASSLADAFDMPVDFFLDLQKQYDVSRARKADPGVRTRATWLSKFPVREMIHRGWIEKTDADLLDLQMMRFFGANRLDDVPLVGCAAPAYAPKKSDNKDKKKGSARYTRGFVMRR